MSDEKQTRWANKCTWACSQSRFWSIPWKKKKIPPNIHKKKQQVSMLWQRQGNSCSSCNKPLTRDIQSLLLAQWVLAAHITRRVRFSAAQRSSHQPSSLPPATADPALPRQSPLLVINNFLEFLIQPINTKLSAEVEHFRMKIHRLSYTEQHSITTNKG